MAAYLTPDRFRTMYFGSDLSVFDNSDIRLASVLARASSLVDTYCGVPLRPQRHSFLGGSITHEQHPWRIAQTPFESAQRRVYPYHTPVIACSSFRIYVTQPNPDVDDGQYVLVAPNDLMTNRTEDYFEVVSSAMTSTGLFNALIVPAIYLATPICTISYTYGYRYEVVGEQLFPTDGLTYSSQNNYWHDDDVAVYINGAVVDEDDYTVNRTEGRIVFDEEPSLGSTVTADYWHKLPVEIRDATGYIASHLIEQSAIVARGMGELEEIEVAEVRMSRTKRNFNTQSSKEWVSHFVPEAAILLDDFSNWRAAV